MFPTIFLKPGREKSVLQRHPWIFSGSMQRVEGDPGSGDTVAVRTQSGQFLGWAAYSPVSQIRARVWSWNEAESLDAGFFRRRFQKAISRRQIISSEATNALRLVHGESDGLPGLIVDRYGDYLVVHLLSAGPELWRETIAAELMNLTGAKGVYERSDVDVRHLEGLEERTGVLAGAEPPERIEIHEHGLRYCVEVRHGHKTGFYLDQRDNRLRLRPWCPGKEVLDCFSYTGAFTANALAGGAASVLSIDSSSEAQSLGTEHIRLNGLPEDRAQWMEGDVFKVLRTLRDQGRSFDLIVMDPPKFAPTVAQAERAARGYKDINLLAFKLLRPGGTLFTFSCSGGVSADLFQKIVAGAALDAGVEAQIAEHLSQAADHPVALSFPEGTYLKGLVCTI